MAPPLTIAYVNLDCDGFMAEFPDDDAGLFDQLPFMSVAITIAPSLAGRIVMACPFPGPRP